MPLLEKLNKNDQITDVEITTNSKYANGEQSSVSCAVIGDHVYMLTNSVDTAVIARDKGNGHGVVISVTKYNK